MAAAMLGDAECEVNVKVEALKAAPQLFHVGHEMKLQPHAVQCSWC